MSFEELLAAAGTAKKLVAKVDETLQIDSDSFAALCRVLRSNQQLEHLELSGLNLSGGKQHPEPAHRLFGNLAMRPVQKLAELIRQNSYLKTLVLRGNQLGDEGAIMIAQALKKNETLCELDISENGITARGTQAVIESLSENLTLEKLHLDHCGVNDDHVALLVDILELRPLTHCSLSNNEIGDDGALLIAKLLETDQTLAALGLDKNNFTLRGASALRDALKKNSTITQMSLPENTGVTVQEDLKKQIALNDALRRLQLTIRSELHKLISNGNGKFPREVLRRAMVLRAFARELNGERTLTFPFLVSELFQCSPVMNFLRNNSMALVGSNQMAAYAMLARLRRKSRPRLLQFDDPYSQSLAQKNQSWQHVALRQASRIEENYDFKDSTSPFVNARTNSCKILQELEYQYDLEKSLLEMLLKELETPAKTILLEALELALFTRSSAESTHCIAYCLACVIREETDQPEPDLYADEDNMICMTVFANHSSLSPQ